MSAAVTRKRCGRCGIVKPLADFRLNRTNTTDGRQTYCKPCQIAYNLSWRELNPDKRPNPRLAEHRAWNNANPEKRKAHKLVALAIRRGSLVRPETCPKCGRKVALQAHHEDYAQPLEVDWLCARCHARHHFSTGVEAAAHSEATA